MSRSAIIIAIDGSISMQEWTTLFNTRMRKMEAAALIANFAIDELVIRSTRAGNLRDYYDITLFRYSGEGIEPIIASEDNNMVHINTLSESIPQPVCYNIVQEEEDGTYSTIPLTLNEWVTPKAYGIAPMYEAMVHIKDILTRWRDDTFNLRSFPPIVINIMDGCCSDAEERELIDIAEQIKSICTHDGNTLLVNIHLANELDAMQSIVFPTLSDNFSSDHDSQMLYDMSSILPDELKYTIMDIIGSDRHSPRKCFARNASICEILTMTDIGTEARNKYCEVQNI